MQKVRKQFIFPEIERKLYTKYAVALFVCTEVLLHGALIGASVFYRNNGGVYLSLFFALLFGLVHVYSLKYRKYCLAQWSFDGDAFHVYINDEIRSVSVNKQFCISSAELSFGRRYGAVTYPFLFVWEPGNSAPYEKMGAYAALKQRKALILPYCDDVLRILNDQLYIKEVPVWPRSGIYYGISK